MHPAGVCHIRAENNLQLTIYNLQFTVYNLQFTIDSLQFTIDSLQFTIDNLQFTIDSLQFTIYNLHFTVYAREGDCVGSVHVLRWSVNISSLRPHAGTNTKTKCHVWFVFRCCWIGHRYLLRDVENNHRSNSRLLQNPKKNLPYLASQRESRCPVQH